MAAANVGRSAAIARLRAQIAEDGIPPLTEARARARARSGAFPSAARLNAAVGNCRSLRSALASELAYAFLPAPPPYRAFSRRAAAATDKRVHGNARRRSGAIGWPVASQIP